MGAQLGWAGSWRKVGFMKGSFEGWVELPHIIRERCDRMREAEGRNQFEEFREKLLHCWMRLEEITFLQQPHELSSFPCSWDY